VRNGRAGHIIDRETEDGEERGKLATALVANVVACFMAIPGVSGRRQRGAGDGRIAVAHGAAELSGKRFSRGDVCRLRPSREMINPNSSVFGRLLRDAATSSRFRWPGCT
jgi:hypothetical protein